MDRNEVPIHTPCGADWSKMTPTEARARLCAECNKSVHDLSAMSEGEVRALVARGPVCVRYLYDAQGRILFGAPPPGATVVPASALLSKAAKTRWLAAAAVAASAIVFEACGGSDGGGGYGYAGGFDRRTTPTAPESPESDEGRRYDLADAQVSDAPATDDDTASPDAGADPDGG